MSIKKNTNRKFKNPADYFKDFHEWPENWLVVEKDRAIANNLLALFTPFVGALIQDELSVKTIKKHMGNLSLLGSEIIRSLNDGNEKHRKLQTKQLLLKYIDAEEGPLLHHIDPNDSADEARQRSFDATCHKLCRFILASK
jgi:hypothetical protein